jgi:DNA-binding CsgD family transcriptional regulator
MMGRLSEAQALAAGYLEHCRQTQVPHLIAQSMYLVASVSEPDNAGGALSLARGAVEILVGSGSRWRLGLAELILGAVLRRTGERVEAREHLRSAITILENCHAFPFAGFARSELAATGAHATRGDDQQLRPSERRVAELVLAGLSNPDIAARLFLSRKTVEAHVSAILRKLAIDSREELRPEHLGVVQHPTTNTS